ncbi:SAM domain-containing protein kinase-like protein, partial [Euroglyphus maynei]
MLLHGVADSEMIHIWLQKIQMSQYEKNFLDACYDMATISRMTPQDLIAIGITDPQARSLFTSEIQKLKVPENLPDYRPVSSSLLEWLKLLNLDCYHQGLCQQGYDSIDRVLQLTWEDLEDVGINKLGHQKKIILAIKKTKSIKSSSSDMNDSCSSRPTSNGNDFRMKPPSPSLAIYDQAHLTKLPYHEPVTIDTLAFSSGQTTGLVPNTNSNSESSQQPFQDVMIKMYANHHTPRSMASPINNDGATTSMMMMTTTNRPMMENCHIIDKRTNPMAPMIMAMDSKSQRMHTFPYRQTQPNLMRNNSMVQNCNSMPMSSLMMMNQSCRRRSLESLNTMPCNESFMPNTNNINDNGSPVIYANMSNIILNSTVQQPLPQRLLSPYQYSNNCDPPTTINASNQMIMNNNRQTILFPEPPRFSPSVSTFSNDDHFGQDMIEQQTPDTITLNRPKILMMTNSGQKSGPDSNMIEMNNHRQQSPRVNMSNSDIYSTFNQQLVRKKPPPPPPPRRFNCQQPQSNSMPATPIHQIERPQSGQNDDYGDDVLFVKQFHLNLATPNAPTQRNDNFFANCVKTMTNNFSERNLRDDTAAKSGLRMQNPNTNRTLPLAAGHQNNIYKTLSSNMITNSSSSSAESMYFANDNIGTIKHNMPPPSFGHSSS